MREKLAELCHNQRSDWMEYLFEKSIPYKPGRVQKGSLIIPKWAFNRWKKQINTPYNELSEEEKEKDRKEADKFIALFSQQ